MEEEAYERNPGRQLRVSQNAKKYKKLFVLQLNYQSKQFQVTERLLNINTCIAAKEEHTQIVTSLMKAVILLLITSSCYSFFDGKQSVGVKGRLTCNGKPARGVLVTYKLFNKRMVSGYTNENGAFKLQSSAIKMPKVKPQLQIDHSCNQKGAFACMLHQVGHLIIPSFGEDGVFNNICVEASVEGKFIVKIRRKL
ncbi:Transthyretin-like family protein [Ancylostoma ceylanicum]|uniref:Transthyretin-like family protein n=1 Tax=Ancylostoma ceylanicum TaxID=53326 RepID=A0A0D6LN38_9BILA|nr:Transthyretin-like family protein [Ancylostoma ceylanicum]